jgi:hypothetical protein
MNKLATTIAVSDLATKLADSRQNSIQRTWAGRQAANPDRLVGRVAPAHPILPPHRSSGPSGAGVPSATALRSASDPNAITPARTRAAQSRLLGGAANLANNVIGTGSQFMSGLGNAQRNQASQINARDSQYAQKKDNTMVAQTLANKQAPRGIDAGIASIQRAFASPAPTPAVAASTGNPLMGTGPVIPGVDRANIRTQAPMNIQSYVGTRPSTYRPVTGLA